MLGPAPLAMGGIASVVKMYEDGGLFSQWPVEYIRTYEDAGWQRKVWLALCAISRVFRLGITGRLQGVHVHVAQRTSFWRKSIFIWLASLFRVPSIIHVHASQFDVFYEDECGGLAKRYVRACLRASSAIVVLSTSWKAWMEQVTDNPRVRIIFNPADLHGFSDEPNHEQREPRVLFLGRLGERKGLAELINAIAGIHQEVPGIHLDIGGDGDDSPFRDLVDKHGLQSCVTFHGWIAGDDKANLLQSTAVLALPSYNEGLPMAILEAMAAGVPVVASDVGGIPDAIEDGAEGLLVKAGDEPGLSHALARLLTDAALRDRLGANARAKVRRHFAVDRVLAELGTLYAELGFDNEVRTNTKHA